MVNRHFVFPLLVGLLLHSGCASSHRASLGEEQYREADIAIICTSDDDLNAYEGRPHALLLVAYQLDSPNAFRSAASTPEGLSMLLSSQPFDKSVLDVRSFSIEPASRDTLLLRRADQARWVCLVAGYNALDPSKAITCHPVPVSHTIGIPLVSKSKAKPRKLDIAVRLTASKLLDNPAPTP